MTDFRFLPRTNPYWLWQQLGDISIDSSKAIEQPFLWFPVSTHREDIWHWFEAEYSLFVVEDLMRMKPGDDTARLTQRNDQFYA